MSPEAVIPSHDQFIILSHFQCKFLQITWISVASEESTFTWKWWQSNKRNVDGGIAECATHSHSGFWFSWLLKGSVGRGIGVTGLLGLYLIKLHMSLHEGYIFGVVCMSLIIFITEFLLRFSSIRVSCFMCSWPEFHIKIFSSSWFSCFNVSCTYSEHDPAPTRNMYLSLVVVCTLSYLLLRLLRSLWHPGNIARLMWEEWVGATHWHYLCFVLCV